MRCALTRPAPWPMGPHLAALLCDISPSSAGWLAEEPEASEPPERLSAVSDLQLPSATGGHHTSHQVAGNQRPCGGIEHPDPHPTLIHTRRLELNADGERGSHGKPGRAGPQRPHRGQSLRLPTQFPGLPSGCSSAACPYSGCLMAAPQANVHRKRGPAGPPPARPWPLRAPKPCPPPPPAACGPPKGR
jgi:hypothetical protein